MRILTPLFRYGYGDPSRGDSLEKAKFVSALSSCAEVYPFWLEEHGFPNDLGGLQCAIITEAERLDPDLIFFFLMRDEVRPETIVQLNKRWPTANWFADDQWRFESFTQHIAPLIHYPITVDKFSLPKYKAIGCSRVILSQWASSYVPLIEPIVDYKYEISFIGGRNNVREWYIYALEHAGFHVHCFGAGWPEGQISYEKMNNIIQLSKINLNLSNSQPSDITFCHFIVSRIPRAILGFERKDEGYFGSIKNSLRGVSNFIRSPKRIEQIKARNFEIPALGGFQLSQFGVGIEDYFVPGKEIALFSSVGELVNLAKYYLENNIEREAIRIAGNRRAAEYTYEQRFRKIVERIANDQS